VRRASTLALFAAALAACEADRRPVVGDAQPATPTAAAPPPAALPISEQALAPSEMRLLPGGKGGRWLADVEDCDGCHAEIVAEWRTSAHAFASFNNPFYRVSVERFRAEVGAEKSRHCAGCHDISLLVDGAMDHPIDPADSRAHGGVTCKTCHGIVATRPDGNGSYTLSTAPIPIPKEGDAESLRLHKARVTPEPLRSAEMCASCHKAFLGEGTGNAHFLAGTDDPTPWRRSVYAGSLLERIDDPVEKKDCRGCHMPREDASRDDAAAKKGKVASHRFLGGHTMLAAMRKDEAHLARAQKQLEGAASIDVAAVVHASGERTLPADGARVSPGEALVFDVVVRNRRVGHRFPGGTLDAQDTWVEVTVEDAKGKRLGEAGAEHEASGADPSAHRLAALLLGQNGQPLFEREVNRFRAVAINHTILPRDAATIEVSFTAPRDLREEQLPLKVTALLRHRSRTMALGRAACEASKTREGISFRGKTPLDACVSQPITEVARREVWIGSGWEKRAKAHELPSWRRLLEHAYGLRHAVQERLDEARPSLLAALAEVEKSGSAREQAMVLSALGWLEVHEGRTQEALGWLKRAEALLPDHPALAALEGEAFGLVWRWDEATGPLEEATRAAPEDDGAWMRLSVARGSRGDAAGALAAAREGLGLQPRDPDMLRVQALSLRALGGKGVEAAEEAYQRFRPADDVPGIKSACSMKVLGCALERSPLHVHRMR